MEVLCVPTRLWSRSTALVVSVTLCTFNYRAAYWRSVHDHSLCVPFGVFRTYKMEVLWHRSFANAFWCARIHTSLPRGECCSANAFVSRTKWKFSNELYTVTKFARAVVPDLSARLHRSVVRSSLVVSPIGRTCCTQSCASGARQSPISRLAGRGVSVCTVTLTGSLHRSVQH